MTECLTDLRSVREQAKILPLFQSLFPTRFRSAMHHARSTQEHMHALFTSFLKAIDNQYFPVDDIDLDYIMEHVPHIPLPLYNYDVESEFDGAPFAHRLTAALVGPYSYAPPLSDLRAEAPMIQFPPCWADDEHRCHGDLPLFTELCARHPAPVRHYPLLYSTFAHDTGSIFLDASYDTGDWDHEFIWSLEDIRTLQIHWRRAKTIMKRNTATIKALSARPSHWNTIFHCWADMCRHTLQKES